MTDSLFDFVPESDLPPRSAWQEVSQTTFLSWSEAEQLDYCARRDDDSAAHAPTERDAEFFRNRANDYREMMKHVPS